MTLLIVFAIAMYFVGIFSGFQIGRAIGRGSAPQILGKRACSHPDVRYEGFTWESWQGVFRCKLTLACCLCGALIFQAIPVTKKGGKDGSILKNRELYEALENLGWVQQTDEEGKKIERWWK